LLPEGAHEFELAGTVLQALPSGALFWPGAALLVAADLHLGRAARPARGAGALLPPYEAAETLSRLSDDLVATGAQILLLLGDSFDATDAADDLDREARAAILALAAGRRLIWLAGNHDPGPVDLPGTQRDEFRAGGLVFRHTAAAGAPPGEVSGHYHPKISLTPAGRRITRRCFLTDGRRLILPAYGAYAGGLDAGAPALADVIARPALAILTGPCARAVRLQPARSISPLSSTSRR